MPVVHSPVQDPSLERIGKQSRGKAGICAVAFGLVLLSGCGQRGPLYVPNGAPGSGVSQAAPLLSTPLFPGLPLSSDTSETPTPTPAIQVQPAATDPDGSGDSSNQPGLKLTPSQP